MFFHFLLFDCNLRTYGINNNKEAKAECAGIFYIEIIKKIRFPNGAIAVATFHHHPCCRYSYSLSDDGKSDVIRKCVRFNDAPKWMIFPFYDFKLLFFSFSFLYFLLFDAYSDLVSFFIIIII